MNINNLNVIEIIIVLLLTGKTQDFNVEEVTSKILKIDEPQESFPDEKFTNVVLKLLKNIKNNKEVVKLRIIEFISEILPENDT